MRAGLDPRGDGRQARRRPRHRSHHEMEAGRERPAPLGGHLAGVTRSQGAMAPVGTVIPGRRFHELEGQGWRPQLVVPADRRGSLLQRFHGGMIGAHLGMARTLALAEQGFYWPGMRADVSRICNECDCAMLKRRRGRREPLHQYIVGVPMERLAMGVAGPYPVTSTGNQYCLMVGCYFSKWLECFPIPDQMATKVARKLVYEIMARYGAF